MSEEERPQEPPFGTPMVRATPVTQMESQPFDPERAAEYVRQLEEHGGVVEQTAPHWTIRFPEGTTRQEIFPRTLEAHFELRFADGFTLSEVRKRDGLSYLFFPQGHEGLEPQADGQTGARGEDTREVD